MSFRNHRKAMFAAPAIIGIRAGANVLTRMLPDLYAGMNIVSRELVGFAPSVTRNVGMDALAQGQTIVYPIAPQRNAQNVTPAMVVPEPTDFSLGNGTMTLDKYRTVEFGFTGEEQRILNAGPGYQTVQSNLFAEGLRTLVNEMEADLAVRAAANASRAVGTPGTAPFATGVRDAASVRRVLDDNGAPPSRSLIIDTAAGENYRSNSQLTKVNEAGMSMTLRDGMIADLSGLMLKESAQIVTQIAGNAAGATTNAAGYAKGATVITLASAGTGAIKNNDVISFAGDTNKYVVTATGGDTDVSNGGTITIGLPGLRLPIPAAATAITVAASHSCNVGFSEGALVFGMRPPARPVEGDARIDSTIITDPRSGLSFEVSVWPGYRKIRVEVAALWGTAAPNPAHIALLMG